MAEYVERETALKIIDNYGKTVTTDAVVVVEAIKDIVRVITPAADVVEVVRCKDCKHHHWEQEPCHGKVEHFCSVLNAQVFADFYCFHGAKMDGKGEDNG